MKKKYLLLSFVFVAALTVMNTSKVNSKINFPPYGSCGDPVNTTTCVQGGCHGAPTHVASPQSLALKIGSDSSAMVTLDSTFKYVANQTYYVSFKILTPAYVYGFQLTALDPTNNMAGSFAVVSPTTTRLQVGPPDYIGHKNANTTVNSWMFKWTAPAATAGNVSFYYAFNPGDSTNYTNATPGADIYLGSTTIAPGFGVGIEDLSSKISEVQVYPNPVNGAFGLSFDLKKAGAVSASLYSIDGKLCQEFFGENLNIGKFSRNFDISSVSAGIYLVKLNVGGSVITKKIVKE